MFLVIHVAVLQLLTDVSHESQQTRSGRQTATEVSTEPN